MTEELFYEEFDDAKYDIVTTLDYRTEDGCGWYVLCSCDTGRCALVNQDENDIDIEEVEEVARLTYSAEHDWMCSESTLISMFDCACCGEQVLDDSIVYLWYGSLEKED